MHNARVFLNRVRLQGLHVRFFVFTSVSLSSRPLHCRHVIIRCHVVRTLSLLTSSCHWSSRTLCTIDSQHVLHQLPSVPACSPSLSLWTATARRCRRRPRATPAAAITPTCSSPCPTAVPGAFTLPRPPPPRSPRSGAAFVRLRRGEPCATSMALRCCCCCCC